MTVKELIEQLQSEDPDRIVICQKDGEGNGFSPLSEIYTAAYAPDSSWSGECGIEELTDLLKENGFTEEDVLTGGQPALVLCPIN